MVPGAQGRPTHHETVSTEFHVWDQAVTTVIHITMLCCAYNTFMYQYDPMAWRRIALVAICFIWLFIILTIGITFGVHNSPVTYRGKVYTYLAIFECSTPQKKRSNLCSRSLLLVNLQLLYKKHRHYGHPRTNVVHAYWVLLIIQQWNERIRIPIKVRVNCKAK